jgi:glycosyltransferase involved in cell wall biosynthesis
LKPEVSSPTSEGLVSVVIPTYNRARYIAETLESVLAQAYAPVEVVVVDDGSTDDTRAVVERYVPAVTYVWQENAERGAARNRGLALARGEFVAFLDSDDVWLPGKLEREVELLRRRPDVGLVYSDTEVIDADGELRRRVRHECHEGWVTEHLLRRNFISIGAHLVRADALRAAGGFREDRALAGSEDWEAWVRLSLKVQFAHLPGAFARIRVHPSNTMSDAATMERGMRYAYELVSAADYLTPRQRRLLPRARAKVAFHSAINYCVAGDRKRTWALLAEAVRCAPGVVLDPRFGYTCVHGMLPIGVSKYLRAARQHATALRARRRSA